MVLQMAGCLWFGPMWRPRNHILHQRDPQDEVPASLKSYSTQCMQTRFLEVDGQVSFWPAGQLVVRTHTHLAERVPHVLPNDAHDRPAPQQRANEERL